jgi:L-aspartate oxidase
LAEDGAAARHGVPAALSQRWALGDVPRYNGFRHTDVLVIGSGIAGLTAALKLAEAGASVIVATKDRLSETSTWYAQGGIAGAVGEADSVELHVADTLVVGQGLCDERVVRAVIEEAPDALAALRARGMHFDLAAGGEIALAREGGHSLPRVLHSGDATGAAILDALTYVTRAEIGIEVWEQAFLVDLLTAYDGGRCRGAAIMDTRRGDVISVDADAVVLASGGAGQAYRVTTNPTVATGDGVAAAWRAGVDIADMEFVQFHPTALDHDRRPRFLITEALRGEGAYLLDCDQQRFMLDVHPLAELAPRDVVSREIERVMQRCGRNNVWLDARHLGDDYLKARFPTIVAACADAGYDLGRDLVPVAPAAHYLIGGVLVDVDGRTSMPGLYASGECSASGLHGANRLASNSLLEGLVFSRRIARAIGEELEGRGTKLDVPDRVNHSASESAADDSAVVSARESCSPEDITAAVGRLNAEMSDHVAMSRDEAGLHEALVVIAEIAAEITPADARREAIEAVNLATVGALIATAADVRTESRGCHSRLDFPERNDAEWRRRLVWRRGAGYCSIGVTDGG